MGRRSIINKYPSMAAADSTVDPSSEDSEIHSVDFFTYEIEIDSSVDANLEVYVCNDKEFSEANSKQLDFGQATALLGSSETSYLVHIKNMGFRHAFFKVVNNGGTGNVSGWLTGTVGGA